MFDGMSTSSSDRFPQATQELYEETNKAGRNRWIDQHCVTNLATLILNDDARDLTKNPRAPLPRSLWTECVAKFLHFDEPDHDMVYLIGGRRNGNHFGEVAPLDSIEVYDRFAHIWFPQPSMKTARVGCSAASLGGKIYVMGGWTGNNNRTVLSSVEVFDPRWETKRDGSDPWGQVKNMLTPRFGHGCVALDGYIYVVGGNAPTNPSGELDADEADTNALSPSASCERYDPTTNTWESIASLTWPRAGGRTVVVHGKLTVMGGCCNEHGVLATVEQYDPMKDAWEVVGRMRVPRSAAGIATNSAGTGVFAVGGCRSLMQPNSCLDSGEFITFPDAKKKCAKTTRSPSIFSRGSSHDSGSVDSLSSCDDDATGAGSPTGAASSSTMPGPFFSILDNPLGGAETQRLTRQVSQVSQVTADLKEDHGFLANSNSGVFEESVAQAADALELGNGGGFELEDFEIGYQHFAGDELVVGDEDDDEEFGVLSPTSREVRKKVESVKLPAMQRGRLGCQAVTAKVNISSDPINKPVRHSVLVLFQFFSSQFRIAIFSQLEKAGARF